jgi:hypothetical protein
MVETNKNRFNKRHGFAKDKSHSLAELAKISGVKKSILQQVYNRGTGAFKTNRAAVRPNVKSAQQWSFARVYSFLAGGKTRTTADKDLWKKHKESKK